MSLEAQRAGVWAWGLASSSAPTQLARALTSCVKGLGRSRVGPGPLVRQLVATGSLWAPGTTARSLPPQASPPGSCVRLCSRCLGRTVAAARRHRKAEARTGALTCLPPAPPQDKRLSAESGLSEDSHLSASTASPAEPQGLLAEAEGPSQQDAAPAVQEEAAEEETYEEVRPAPSLDPGSGEWGG